MPIASPRARSRRYRSRMEGWSPARNSSAAMASRWRVTGRRRSRSSRRKRSARASASSGVGLGIRVGREPERGIDRGRRLLLVGALGHQREQLVQGLERAAPEVVEVPLELAPLLPLDGEREAGRRDAAAVAVHPGEDRGAELAALTADDAEGPDPVDLPDRDLGAKRSGEALPGGADARPSRCDDHETRDSV